MLARRRYPRFVFWAMAFALLLKAAVPVLAAAAAQRQGKTLIEVCTVYGVETVALNADGSLANPQTDGSGSHGAPGDHGGEHCVLSGLLAYSAPADPSVVALPAVRGLLPPSTVPSGLFVPDAIAAWAARLQHAPPLPA